MPPMFTTAPGILGPAVVATGLAAMRWLAQGAGNVYTDLGRRFYVADPDLGWRAVEERTLFLGLDVVAGLAGLVVGLAVVLVFLNRRERRGKPRLGVLRG